MREPVSPYLSALRQAEAKTLLRQLFPAAFWLWRRRRYRKTFPDAYVSYQSFVALDAVLGTGCIVRRGCEVGANVAMDRYTTLGDNCVLRGGGRITIGPFCSIASEVAMLSENHVMDRITTFPLALYQGNPVAAETEFIPADVTIGPDVWIGQRAIVLGGADIGIGSVVAAGSVVTKGSYEPYSVLAGVPARLVKYRLNAESRQALLKSKWWLEPKEHIFGDWLYDLQNRMIPKNDETDG